MQFYFISKPRSPKRRQYPCVTLSADNWDDFHYRTLFSMEYFPRSGKSIPIGPVKIASDTQQKKKITPLDDEFKELPDNYFSLGQTLKYYESLTELGRKVRDEILHSLRDIVIQPDLIERFRRTEVYTSSLVRFSEAVEVQRDARRLFFPEEPTEESTCSFLFEVELKAAAEPFQLSVVLGNEPRIPDRIMALIGKNGTGKTWLLGRLAAALSGDEVKVGLFSPRRPAFRRVLAVSYSAFDKFNKPTTTRKFSYVYCGVYDKLGQLNAPRKLIIKLRQAATQILEKKRRTVWREIFEAVLDSSITSDMEEYLFSQKSGKSPPSKRPELSSGQLVLASTITELVAYIENNSIVLLDEPEMHQHPNSVAGLLFSLNQLLIRFESFAIIATHSPLVIQQIPAQYVRQFIRSGNATVIRNLRKECFGENLSSITEEIFQTVASPSLYQTWFKHIAGGLSEDEVLTLFPNGLSFNALSTMHTLKEAQ